MTVEEIIAAIDARGLDPYLADTSTTSHDLQLLEMLVRAGHLEVTDLQHAVIRARLAPSVPARVYSVRLGSPGQAGEAARIRG